MIAAIRRSPECRIIDDSIAQIAETGTEFNDVLPIRAIPEPNCESVVCQKSLIQFLQGLVVQTRELLISNTGRRTNETEPHGKIRLKIRQGVVLEYFAELRRNV